MDVAAFVKMGGKRNKDVGKILEDLGLNGLRSLVMYSGFDGRVERGLIEWDMPGPRKGLLTLLSGKPFQLSDVPPLPPDVVSWTMTNFDTASFYDTAYLAVEHIVRLVSPDDVPKIKEFTKQANDLLGVDLRKDLLGSLGDRFAYYSSPADGPLTLGQTVLFKVKDADKLQTTLEQIIKSLGTAAGKEVRIKKRDYRGLTIHEVHVQQQGFIFVPTYTIQKDWLVVGFYPQAVQAFIQRSKGELAVWKPSPVVQRIARAIAQGVHLHFLQRSPAIAQAIDVDRAAHRGYGEQPESAVELRGRQLAGNAGGDEAPVPQCVRDQRRWQNLASGQPRFAGPAVRHHWAGYVFAVLPLCRVRPVRILRSCPPISSVSRDAQRSASLRVPLQVAANRRNRFLDTPEILLPTLTEQASTCYNQPSPIGRRLDAWRCRGPANQRH